MLFDAHIRDKICEFLPLDELIECRYLCHTWKKTVDLFMMNKLIKEYGIERVFLKHFTSCHFCDIIHKKRNVKRRYGPSFSWGIKEYVCCNKCETQHEYLFEK